MFAKIDDFIREFEEESAITQRVLDALTDESLDQGENWTNGASLRYSLRHEIHHRGQMTVLMRQAGLRVPDVLGPTRDDWIAKGMEPHA